MALNLGLEEDKDKTLTPSTLEPLSKKTWTFDDPQSLYNAPKTTGDTEVSYQSMLEEGEAFAPDLASKIKEDIASRGADPFSTSTEYYKAMDEDRKFMLEEVLPEKAAIGKEATNLAGESYTPSFGDVLPLLAVALFSDDDAFNEGFFKSYSANKENKFKSTQQKRMAELQDRAQAIELKAAFLSKNVNFYSNTMATDKAMIAEYGKKIQEEKKKWTLSQTPVINNVLGMNLKEQVDSLKKGTMLPVKSNDEVLQQIMSQMPDKGIKLTQKHKDTILEVYNDLYTQHMSGSIIPSFAKGTLDPTSRDKDTTSAVANVLVKEAAGHGETSSGIAKQAKLVLSKDLTVDQDKATREFSTLKTTLSERLKEYTVKDAEGKDAPVSMLKFLDMSPDEIKTMVETLEREKANSAPAGTQTYSMPKLRISSLLEIQKSFNDNLKIIADDTKGVTNFSASKIEEAASVFNEVFTKIANSTPEYKANLEKFGKEYDINIPELSTTLSIHLSSQGYSNLYNSVVSVAYFNTPEFWKLQSNSKERLITEGKAKNLTEEEALKQDPFFKSIKDLSKSSTASIDEKKAALDYLARESFQFQSKVEQGTKGLVTSEPLQAIKASYEEANKKEKGFFVTVSTDSLKKAQDKVHTVKEATKVSGEVLTDVLQIKYGMDEETAKLVGARIIDGTYRGRPNYLNIRTILLP